MALRQRSALPSYSHIPTGAPLPKVMDPERVGGGGGGGGPAWPPGSRWEAPRPWQRLSERSGKLMEMSVLSDTREPPQGRPLQKP